MILRLKPLDMETGRNIAVMHEDDAEFLGHMAGDRIKVATPNVTVTLIANTTRRMVQKGELGAFVEATRALGLEDGEDVEISLASRPQSAVAIKRKMAGEALSREEIGNIIRDIVLDNLTATELAAFVVSQQIRGMTMDEVKDLTMHMVETGEKLELNVSPVLDVHSIGGVPGNKYALVAVPIVAAAGLTIPKTSSRAITSAAGTADVMEVLANVNLGMDEIKKIATRVGGVLAWGGAVKLAPADDIIIKAERMLGIDPKPQLLASVMAKKMAVGADHVLIDIPAGPGAKVEKLEDARILSHDFIELGHKLGILVDAAVTYGGQPVGYSIGPALEAKEALETLMGNGPGSLIEKSTSLAGVMLELGGAAPPGLGRQMAAEILKSGKAYQKMREIIAAQGGDPDVKVDDLPIGDKKEVVTAPISGYITRIHNQKMNEIARAAGAPYDKGAGIKLVLKTGRKVEKGEPLMEIYAEHEGKLEEAIVTVKKNSPIKIEGMLLEKISHRPHIELD
ncbi:MAG: AMP phosphorylase [Candidatus Hadarchaeota archaeon]